MTITFYVYNGDYEMLFLAERLFNKTIRAWYNIEGAKVERHECYITMSVDVRPEHAWPMKYEFNRRLCRIHRWNSDEPAYEFEWTVGS